MPELLELTDEQFGEIVESLQGAMEEIVGVVRPLAQVLAIFGEGVTRVLYHAYLLDKGYPEFIAAPLSRWLPVRFIPTDKISAWLSAATLNRRTATNE